MLKISKTTESPPSFKPNLLPCKIYQNGTVNASPRYWSPKLGEDGKPEAYFRGRKLKGREMKLPEGYRGVIVKAEGAEREPILPFEAEDEEMGEVADVKALEEIGTFDEVVAWGHECLVEDDDAFVKGIDEWLRFSQAMHEPGAESKKLTAQAK